jgi:hypothetical protein
MLPDEYIKSAYQYHGFLFFRKFCPQDISESARIFPTVKKDIIKLSLDLRRTILNGK